MSIGLSLTGTTRDRRSALNIKIHISRSPRVAAPDLPACGLDALVRASVHHCNDETELERFVHVVAGSAPRCDPAVDTATTVLGGEIDRFLSNAPAQRQSTGAAAIRAK